MKEKIIPIALTLGLLTGCVAKRYYTPSKSFYVEGESIDQTCEIAQDKLDNLLYDFCSRSEVNSQSFSCNKTRIRYDEILRLVLVDNSVGEDALYISVNDEEFVLAKYNSEKLLKETADALKILKNCR